MLLMHMQNISIRVFCGSSIICHRLITHGTSHGQHVASILKCAISTDDDDDNADVDFVDDDASDAP